MGIHVQWDNPEKTVIFIEFEGHWSWDDFYALDRQTIAMLDSVEHQVCYIVDTRSTRHLPRGMSLAKVKQVLDFRHPRSDIMVIAGMNRFIRVMLDSVTRAMGGTKKTKIITTNTIEDARRIITERLNELRVG